MAAMDALSDILLGQAQQSGLSSQCNAQLCECILMLAKLIKKIPLKMSGM